MVPFNKPYIPLVSMCHMIRSALGGTISGNGTYTRKCHHFFTEKIGLEKVLLTTSCSDALEMAALLCDIRPGDEVIMPSFTFVSTANAFLLRGAVIRFADTLPGIPNVDIAAIEPLISSRTRAIVVVHYCGVACDMDPVMELARRHGLWVIEDAAHAIDSHYKGRLLGSIGHLGTYSFHETKNIISGEGGLLIVNHEEFRQRAEILWEKGTNRAAFYRGEIDRYGWVDVGSSFLPSDAVAAFLYTQLLRMNRIQRRRKEIWWSYYHGFEKLEGKGMIRRPVVPEYATVNGNFFFLLTRTEAERDRLLNFLRERGIQAVFHYQPLHTSAFFQSRHDGRELPNTSKFAATIIRLPFYNSIRKSQIRYIIRTVESFYSS